MKAGELLDTLQARGARVHLLADDHLGVAPSSALTDDLRAEIRAHKTELIQVLRTEDGSLGAASALEVRQQIGAVMIASPRFGQVWLALDPCMEGRLRAGESQRAVPRPVLTAADLAGLEGKPAGVVDAMLDTLAAFPDAAVLQ